MDKNHKMKCEHEGCINEAKYLVEFFINRKAVIKNFCYECTHLSRFTRLGMYYEKKKYQKNRTALIAVIIIAAICIGVALCGGFLN